MKLQEKITNAEKRIKELKILINFWKQQEITIKNCDPKKLKTNEPIKLNGN